MLRKSFKCSQISVYRTELMGIAALMVILCHSKQPPGIEINNSIISWLITQGNRGVDIFFFVSAIGLYVSLSKFYSGVNPCLRQWYARRYYKVLIPTFLLGCIYYISEGLKQNVLSFSDLILNVSTIGYWISQKGFWYVSLLVPLYLVTPFLFLIYRRVKYKFLLTLFLISCCLIFGDYFTYYVDNYFNVLKIIKKLAAFFFGFYMAEYVTSDKEISYIKICMVFIVGLLIIKCLFPVGSYWEWLLIIPIMIGSVACFNVVFIQKICKLVGSMSLESYLTNGIMLSLVAWIDWNALPYGLNTGNYLRYTVVIIGGVILAYITNSLLNKRVKAHSKKIL